LWQLSRPGFLVVSDCRTNGTCNKTCDKGNKRNNHKRNAESFKGVGVFEHVLISFAVDAIT
jgi:hypothetical protein